MNVRASRRASRLLGESIGSIKGTVYDDLLDPLSADRRNAATLLSGSIRRQIDGAPHAQMRARISQALRVVTGRGTHNTAFALSG